MFFFQVSPVTFLFQNHLTTFKVLKSQQYKKVVYRHINLNRQTISQKDRVLKLKNKHSVLQGISPTLKY